MSEFLENFKSYLKTQKLSDETKRIYLSRVKKIIKNQNINNIEDIKQDQIIDQIKNKNKTYISQTKNAFKLLYRSNDDFFFNNKVAELQESAPKQRKKIESELNLKVTNIKINAVRNKKMKLAFRLQQISGLRIGEIAALEKQDIEFCDDYRIKLHVRHGKGDKPRKFKALQDKYVYNELFKLIENTKKDKVFYCKKYMQDKAHALEFHTHDNRKVFSQIVYYNSSKKKTEKVEMLQKVLGHETGTKTYLKYINRKINFNGTKWDVL